MTEIYQYSERIQKNDFDGMCHPDLGFEVQNILVKGAVNLVIGYEPSDGLSVQFASDGLIEFIQKNRDLEKVEIGHEIVDAAVQWVVCRFAVTLKLTKKEVLACKEQFQKQKEAFLIQTGQSEDSIEKSRAEALRARENLIAVGQLWHEFGSPNLKENSSSSCDNYFLIVDGEEVYNGTLKEVNRRGSRKDKGGAVITTGSIGALPDCQTWEKC